jgi:hypothetical protein
MARRLNLFALSALAICGLQTAATAGDTEVPEDRKEFHLSIVYPYVFRPVGYLQAQGPVAMRYGQPAIDLSDRNAPPLPASAKGVDPTARKKDEKAAASPSPTPDAAAAQKNQTPDRVITTAAPAPAPAYPVPQDAPTPIPKGDADFGKTPDEVDGYFRNQYNFVPDSHRFFDPIFEPAEAPQSAQMGPKSTATYTETR